MKTIGIHRDTWQNPKQVVVKQEETKGKPPETIGKTIGILRKAIESLQAIP